MSSKSTVKNAVPWKAVALGFSMAMGAAGCAVGVDGGYDGSVGVAYTGDYYDPYCCAYGGGWGGWGHDHYRVGPPGRGGGSPGPRGEGPHGGGPGRGGGGPRGGGAPSIPSGARGGGGGHR